MEGLLKFHTLSMKLMYDVFHNFSVIVNCETLLNDAAVGFFTRNV